MYANTVCNLSTCFNKLLTLFLCVYLEFAVSEYWPRQNNGVWSTSHAIVTDRVVYSTRFCGYMVYSTRFYMVYSTCFSFCMVYSTCFLYRVIYIQDNCDCVVARTRDYSWWFTAQGSIHVYCIIIIIYMPDLTFEILWVLANHVPACFRG